MGECIVTYEVIALSQHHRSDFGIDGMSPNIDVVVYYYVRITSIREMSFFTVDDI